MTPTGTQVQHRDSSSRAHASFRYAITTLFQIKLDNALEQVGVAKNLVECCSAINRSFIYLQHIVMSLPAYFLFLVAVTEAKTCEIQERGCQFLFLRTIDVWVRVSTTMKRSNIIFNSIP